MDKMNAVLSIEEISNFEVAVINTGANFRSEMSSEQYDAYCREFMVLRSLRSIGGASPAIESAIIRIPFSDLNYCIDVKFKIIKNKCLTLVFLRDMKDNGPDISIQQQVVTYKHKIQDLVFENDFLKQKWTMQDTVWSLYTSDDLRKFHKSFGPPSVRALCSLLKRTDREEMDSAVRKEAEMITNECQPCAKHQ